MAPTDGRRRADRGKDPATYYVSSDSDRRYAAEARRRVRRSARRKWLVWLTALAVLGVLTHLYGPSLWGLVRARAGATAGEFQQVGDNIRGSAARRAGAELED